MTPKTIKCVDQEKQDTFSWKHENTLKSMEFSEGDEQLCLLTVHYKVSVFGGTRKMDTSSVLLLSCILTLLFGSISGKCFSFQCIMEFIFLFIYVNEKTNNVVFEQARHKLACTVTDG